MKKIKIIKSPRSPKRVPALHIHTELKKTEPLLKESESRLKIAFEDAPDAYYITDIKGTLIDLNRKAEGLFGYKKKELIGKNFLKLKLLSMIEIPKAVAILAKNSLGKLTSPEEFKLIKKDQTPANVEISTYPTKINGKKMVLGIARDITERKKSEKEISFKNAILEGQYETSPDGIWVVGSDGKTISSNKNFLKMWAIPKKLVETRADIKILEFILSNLKDREEFLSKIKYLFTRKNEKSSDEIHLKDGKIFDRRSSPLIDLNNNYLGRIWYFRDVTERQKSAEKIKELNELRNKFIQVVSHQLRTPLTSIRWNLESFLNESFGKITKEQKDIIRLTLEADTIVINRIRDMLTVLDIEEGRSATINKQEASINSLLDSVLAEFEKKIEIKNIDLKYKTSKASIPAINVDLEKIREVFEKLIENAIDYTKEKGRISIMFDKLGGFIRFEITDTGIGIPTAEQSHMFQRFYRGSNAFAMKQDASGIGLYIAKYFIEQHGGKIGFTSKEGLGSTFWFELPITK